ncbi:hypothetical protein L218DRAFT_1007012 [Marasmius fiardii PR-910]|nr:hypothetical protein L218DRAFT_1007012 [Marasmius fiardii PR-910]
MSAPILHISPELLDKILESFNNDKDDLSSLSLVCKAWLPLAHRRLFDRLRIRSFPLNEGCNRILEFSALSCYIRHVALIVSSHNADNEEDRVEHLLRSITQVKQTNTILKCLSIIICGLSNHGLYRHFFGTLSSGSFSDIVELHLAGGHLNDVIPVICSFPRLRVFCGDFMSARVDESRTDSPLLDYFYRWISSHPPRAVTDLSISNLYGFLKFQPFASQFSRSLKTLILEFGVQECNASDFDFSFLDVLESLTVDWEALFNNIPVLQCALETIPSPHFKRFCVLTSSFDLYFNGLRNRFKELDNIIVSEKLGGITIEVQMVGTLPSRVEKAQEEIRALLDNCDKQARLEITQRSHYYKSCRFMHFF